MSSPPAKLQLISSTDGVQRTGPKDLVLAEDIPLDWPAALRSFAPERVAVTRLSDGLVSRTEQHLGAVHSNPAELIQRWNIARASFWTPLPVQTKPLRTWLKQISPAVKLAVKPLCHAWKKQFPDVPIRKSDIQRALDTELSVQLYSGYVHGRLTARRIRERGFVCWRNARTDGLRGIDCAPFVAPVGQPLDVQLHVLKWAWRNAPHRAVKCLMEMGLLHQHHRETNISFSAHPAIKPEQLANMLGCSPGRVSSTTAGKAISRAAKIQLLGQPVRVLCTPPVPKRSDSHFFLPRGRTPTNLFSKWHDGIQLDEQGKYSLTPEHIALDIAKRVPSDTVLDAFCGCGGNTIAFARQPHIGKVIAVDNNPDRLRMAQHNAKIYGVDHKIQFLHRNVFQISENHPFVFADPPWEAGEVFLNRVVQWVQKQHRGWIKLPISYPVETAAFVELVLTSEGYPSFVLWKGVNDAL